MILPLLPVQKIPAAAVFKPSYNEKNAEMKEKRVLLNVHALKALLVDYIGERTG